MLSLRDGMAKAGVVALVLGAVVAGSAVAIAQEEPTPTPSPVMPGQPIQLTPPEVNVAAQPDTVQALPPAIEPIVSPPSPAEPVIVPAPASSPTIEPSVSSVLPAAEPAATPVTPVTPATSATPAAPVSASSPLSALPEAVVAAPPVEQPAAAVPAAEETPAAPPKEEPKPVEPPIDPRVKADEVINSLRQGTFTKPLSLTDMAAINDAIQRMNYLSDIEQKMAELNPNIAGAATAQIAAPVVGAAAVGLPTATAGVVSAVASPTSSARGTVTVLQISGSQGKFKALVSTQDGRTMYVRVGDSLADGQVVGIDLSGVRVRGSYGLDILPFRSQAPVLIGQ